MQAQKNPDFSRFEIYNTSDFVINTEPLSLKTNFYFLNETSSLLYNVYKMIKLQKSVVNINVLNIFKIIEFF
jgi:hypothetical protein